MNKEGGETEMSIHDKLDEVLTDIQTEVGELITNRYIYIEIRNIFDKNSKLSRVNDELFWWIYRNHLYSALMSIRRLYDDDPDCNSLLKFLNIILSNPTILSRQRYVGIFQGDGEYEEANSIFDKIVGKGKDHIDPKEVLKEIDIFKGKKDKFEEFINKRVAHQDKRKVTKIPVTKDLEDFIKYLKELTIKYSMLFDGLDHLDIEPSIQVNWTDIFKILWIQS